jgi:trimeric autotransporter adhesin
MKTIVSVRALFSALFFFLSVEGQLMAQATCAAAVDLTNVSCNTGNLQGALSAAPAGTCGGATSSTTYGVWYKFKASAATASISISGLGSNLTTASTYVEVFNPGVCGSLTSRNCQNVASALNLTSLTAGTEYFIRVYVTTDPTSSPTNRRGFTITLQQTPPNNLCPDAIELTSSTTCTNTTGTLSGATASAPAIASTCTGTPGADVWYRFVAQSNNATVGISSRGAALTATYIQIFSGTCGSFTSLGCFNGTSLTTGGLTAGTTY